MPSLREILPKSRSDAFAFSFTLFGINAIYFFELKFILPWLMNEDNQYSDTKWYFHVFLGTFIYVNALGFFWKIISTETSTKGIILPILLKPGTVSISKLLCIHRQLPTI